jgi:hypothetical protein
MEPEEAVKYFMRRVPELVYFKDNRLQTPLEFACRNILSMDVKAVKTLMHHMPCSILDIADQYGITPLQYCKYLTTLIYN